MQNLGGILIIILVYNTGEKLGIGCYKCTNCGFDINIAQTEKCPTCPNCTNTSYVKVTKLR